VPADQPDPLGELVQALRRLQQHHPGAGEQLAGQRAIAIATGQSEPFGVRGPGQLTGQRIGVAADPGTAEPGGRAQGERAVVIADDRQLARAGRRQRLGGGVQQQPVGGIDGMQVRRLDVRIPPQQRRIQPERRVGLVRQRAAR